MIAWTKAVHIPALTVWCAGLIVLPGIDVRKAIAGAGSSRPAPLGAGDVRSVASPAAFVTVIAGTALIFLRMHSPSRWRLNSWPSARWHRCMSGWVMSSCRFSIQAAVMPAGARAGHHDHRTRDRGDPLAGAGQTAREMRLAAGLDATAGRSSILARYHHADAMIKYQLAAVPPGEADEHTRQSRQPQPSGSTASASPMRTPQFMPAIDSSITRGDRVRPARRAGADARTSSSSAVPPCPRRYRARRRSRSPTAPRAARTGRRSTSKTSQPSVEITSAMGKATSIAWIGWPATATTEPISLSLISDTGLTSGGPDRGHFLARAIAAFAATRSCGIWFARPTIAAPLRLCYRAVRARFDPRPRRASRRLDRPAVVGDADRRDADFRARDGAAGARLLPAGHRPRVTPAAWWLAGGGLVLPAAVLTPLLVYRPVSGERLLPCRRSRRAQVEAVAAAVGLELHLPQCRRRGASIRDPAHPGRPAGGRAHHQRRRDPLASGCRGSRARSTPSPATINVLRLEADATRALRGAVRRVLRRSAMPRDAFAVHGASRRGFPRY